MKRSKIYKFIRAPYTLVEMLVVMGIIAIILGIGIPAFEKMVKGQGLDSAMRQVGGKLGIARAYAITNNKYTAIFFPQTDSNIPEGFPYTQYRIGYVTRSSSGTYSFSNWADGEEWQQLPSGTAVASVTHPVSVSSVQISDISSTATTTISNVIIFNPYGAIAAEHGTNVPVISFQEASVSGTTLTQLNTANTASITMRLFTGRPVYSNEQK